MTESRLWETAYEFTRPNVASHHPGRGIKCPFCGVVTEALNWSLAGSGKRCNGCGATHDGHGTTTRRKP